jgi:hypothetical protein
MASFDHNLVCAFSRHFLLILSLSTYFGKRDNLAGFFGSILLIAPYFGEHSYTRISIYAAAFGMMRELIGTRGKKSPIRYLLANCLANAMTDVNTTSIDTTTLRRVATKEGLSMTVYFIKWTAVSWIPVIILTLVVLSDIRRHNKNVRFRVLTGVFTWTAKLSWAILNYGTINLNRNYVYFNKIEWQTIWRQSLYLHIIAGVNVMMVLQ